MRLGYAIGVEESEDYFGFADVGGRYNIYNHFPTIFLSKVEAEKFLKIAKKIVESDSNYKYNGKIITSRQIIIFHLNLSSIKMEELSEIERDEYIMALMKE